MISVMIGVAAFAVAAATLYYQRRSSPVAHRSEERFKRVRRSLRTNRAALTRSAHNYHHGDVHPMIAPMLAPDDWVPTVPLPLSSVEFTYAAGLSDPVVPYEERLHRVLPADDSGMQYNHLSEAVERYDRPTLWYNRSCFRLTDIVVNDERAKVTLALSRYFRFVDIAEGLAHEYASALLGKVTDTAIPPRRQTRFRRSFAGSVFDLGGRPVIASFTTLTIRKRAQEASFYILHRKATEVAVSGGVYGGIPAGMFQPGTVRPDDVTTEADLWKNIMRETNEEFLNAPDAAGDIGVAISYDAEPYRTLNWYYDRGDITVWFLGVGLDPLSLTGEVLTVMIMSDDAFQRVLGDHVRSNDEGVVIDKLALTRERIVALLDHSELGPGLSAILGRVLRDAPLLGLKLHDG